MTPREPRAPAGAWPLIEPVWRSRSESAVIRLALLSASVLFRSGLRSILGTDRSLEVVAEATSPPVHDLVRRSSPDIILVDAQVKGALSVCGELLGNEARPRVILVEADWDEDWAVHALKTGVRGILTKDATVKHLCKAVRVVNQGEVWASRRVVALSVDELGSRSVPASPSDSPVKNPLSHREKEIVRLILTGLSNQEVAGQLGITEGTVKAHLTHIFQKLNLRTRSQLAAFCHRSTLTALVSRGLAWAGLQLFGYEL
jgi:DNA-binding NarL/FixJ family response regulator